MSEAIVKGFELSEMWENFVEKHHDLHEFQDTFSITFHEVSVESKVYPFLPIHPSSYPLANDFKLMMSCNGVMANVHVTDYFQPKQTQTNTEYLRTFHVLVDGERTDALHVEGKTLEEGFSLSHEQAEDVFTRLFDSFSLEKCLRTLFQEEAVS